MSAELVGMVGIELADEKAYPYYTVANSIPAGHTLDTIATVPADSVIGSRFAIYDRNLYLTNSNIYPGGMLTFVNVVAGYRGTRAPFQIWLPMAVAGP